MGCLSIPFSFSFHLSKFSRDRQAKRINAHFLRPQQDKTNLINKMPHPHILISGSYFWSLGLRVFYFSFPLFLWIFGPIPMFLSSIVLLLMLYSVDVGFESGRRRFIPGTGMEVFDIYMDSSILVINSYNMYI